MTWLAWPVAWYCTPGPARLMLSQLRRRLLRLVLGYDVRRERQSGVLNRCKSVVIIYLHDIEQIVSIILQFNFSSPSLHIN